MNSSQFDALIADLDRAANLFKQLVSAGLIIGGILAALALSGCCERTNLDLNLSPGSIAGQDGLQPLLNASEDDMTRVAFPVAARAERGPSVSTPPPAAVSARGYKMPIRAALLFFCRIVCVALVWSISVIAACLLSGCGLLPQRRDWDPSGVN